MNRREFIKVFTFGVAAAVLPTVAVPEQIPQLGVPFERADGMVVVCFRAGEDLKKRELVAIDSSNTAYRWRIGYPGRKLNGLVTSDTKAGKVVAVCSAASPVTHDGVSLGNTVFGRCGMTPKRRQDIIDDMYDEVDRCRESRSGFIGCGSPYVNDEVCSSECGRKWNQPDDHMLCHYGIADKLKQINTRYPPPDIAKIKAEIARLQAKHAIE